MKRIIVFILVLLCMTGCSAMPARTAETGDTALGEEITDEVMATDDRFESYIAGSWTASDSAQRLTVEEDHFILHTDTAIGQERETPPGDLPVNVMCGADQEGNAVRLTVGTCYENAMTASIDHAGEILFIRDATEQ